MQYSSRLLGEKIRKLREDKNISPIQMADYLGLGIRTYGKIETGERDLTVKEAVKFADKVEVDPEDLIFHEVKMTFEHCDNNSFYNSGAIHYQTVDELHKHYQSLLQSERDHHAQVLQSEREHHAQMQSEKDNVIKSLHGIIHGLKQL